MKKTLLILSLLLTTSAFGQYLNGGYISSQPVPVIIPSHPAHAEYAPLATEQSVVVGGSYLIGQGERPLWDIPRAPEKPLGDSARELKKEHAQNKRARIIWEN